VQPLWVRGAPQRSQPQLGPRKQPLAQPARAGCARVNSATGSFDACCGCASAAHTRAPRRQPARAQQCALRLLMHTPVQVMATTRITERQPALSLDSGERLSRRHPCCAAAAAALTGSLGITTLWRQQQQVKAARDWRSAGPAGSSRAENALTTRMTLATTRPSSQCTQPPPPPPHTHTHTRTRPQ
jgi:hypothetical protein